MPVLIVVFIVLLSGGWFWLEQNTREGMVYAGMPEATTSDWQHWYRVLRNDGYLVGYSDLRLNPLWVSYEIKALSAEQKKLSYKRPSRFDSDWRTVWRVEPGDYKKSGYDRGHMAPNYAVSRLYGREAQLETFVMTNISPQRPNLNRKIWQRLEEAAMDHFTVQFERVHVVTGPVFDSEVERLDSWVEIPDSFYKVFVALDNQGQAISMLGFLIPQTVRGSEPLTKYVVSVDEIEAKTGYDFFHQLNDEAEERLEGKVDPRPWKLTEVARRASRY
jgi:endonuclease G